MADVTGARKPPSDAALAPGGAWGGDLPPPPPGRSGWPWAPCADAVPAAPGGAGTWPRITIVTPSYNQGRFLEPALRSVLLQRYPNLELVVMDGGSVDGSVAILERYARHLAHWQSAGDGGQADAIASGFERATGAIWGWLNSDDILLPGALFHVARELVRRPKVDVLYGNRLVIDEDGAVVGRHVWPWLLSRHHWARGQPLAQECCFWRAGVYRRVGGIDRTRFFVMDYDLFFRMWEVGRFRKTPAYLGALRVHAESKNARHADVWRRELAEAKARYGLREAGYLGARLANRLDRAQALVEALALRARGGPPRLK